MRFTVCGVKRHPSPGYCLETNHVPKCVTKRNAKVTLPSFSNTVNLCVLLIQALLGLVICTIAAVCVGRQASLGPRTREESATQFYACLRATTAQ